MDKDLKKVLKEAEKQGFEVRYTTNGHPMIYKNGAFVAQFAKTGSDHRGLKNGIATLRRAGFRWPP